MSNGGPTNKWVKQQVSTANDPEAQSSDQVLEFFNHYPISAATTVICNDGTFLFVGYYNK